MMVNYDDPNELNDYLMRKFCYYPEVWNSLFVDGDEKILKSLDREGVYIVGQVGEVLFERDSEYYYDSLVIQQIIPIGLNPVELHPLIDDMEVTRRCSQPYEYGNIVICRIKYAQRTAKEHKKINRKRSVIHHTINYFQVTYIKEMKITLEKLKTLMDKCVLSFKKRIEEDNIRLEEEVTKKKTEIEEFEKEKGEFEDQKKSFENELMKFDHLSELFGKLMTLLEDGKENELSYEDLSKVKNKLINELWVTTRIMKANDINKKLVPAFVMENENLKQYYEAKKKECDELCADLNGIILEIGDSEKEKRERERELEKIKEANHSLSVETVGEVDKLLDKYHEVIHSEEAREYIHKLIQEKKEELKNEKQEAIKKEEERLELVAEHERKKINDAHLAEMGEVEKEKTVLEENLQNAKEDLKQQEEVLRKTEESVKQQIDENARKSEEYEQKKAELNAIISGYESYISEAKGNYLKYLKKYVDRIENVEKTEIERIREHAIKDENGSTYGALIDHVKGYLWNRGKHYKNTDRIVTQFISAIGSGQIILLTGAPGSGKSSFPRSVGNALGADVREIAVQPNWTDSQDILGYYNPKDKSFVHTDFLDALIDAQKDDERMYFIVLDEMNLAHVEYYFSVLLSVMESDGKLTLISETNLNELPEDERDTLKNLRIGNNVQFIGTINIDDLSKGISPKVVDRSMIIELSSEEDRNVINDALSKPEHKPEQIEPWSYSSTFFRYSEYEINPGYKDDTDSQMNIVEGIYNGLQEFYKNNKAGIIGSPVRFSKRSEKRIRYMLERGARIEDVILGRILPCVNWEMSGKKVDEFKTVFNLQNGNDEQEVNEAVANKIDAMLDRSGESVILDYWLDSRR